MIHDDRRSSPARSRNPALNHRTTSTELDTKNFGRQIMKTLKIPRIPTTTLRALILGVPATTSTSCGPTTSQPGG